MIGVVVAGSVVLVEVVVVEVVIELGSTGVLQLSVLQYDMVT